MVQAIASTSAFAAYGGGAPAFASLQAQLQRYEQQLSECINCASARTPEGKADIEAISARIAQVKGRIVQADEIPAVSEPRRSSPPGLGGVVDVYA